MKRTFQFTDEKPGKFWTIKSNGNYKPARGDRKYFDHALESLLEKVNEIEQ